MRTRRIGSWVLGLALILGAAACDDNPIDEGTDQATRFQVNPTYALVNAGGEVTIEAILVNTYGQPVHEPVTAEPCGSLVSVERDTSRLAFEPPERFIVSVQPNAGSSCVVVRGAGLVDTIDVRVIPADLRLTGGADTVGSGSSVDFGVQFLTEAGTAATGFTLNDIVFATDSVHVGVITPEGEFTAQAPGVVVVSATLRDEFGAEREITKRVFVVPGVFGGTVTPTPPTEGGLMTIHAGAIPFDDDTQVFVDGDPADWILSQTATEIVMPTPHSGSLLLTNLGPNQVAQEAEIEIVSMEPLDDDLTTERIINVGDSTWVGVGGADIDDFVGVVIPAAGDYDVNLAWMPEDADIDIYFFRPDGSFTSFGGTYPCATGSNPEVCTVTLTAGTWYFLVEMYDPHGNPHNTGLLKVTAH